MNKIKIYIGVHLECISGLLLAHHVISKYKIVNNIKEKGF